MKKENTLPPAIFIGGTLGLDFLNSIATPVDEVVEWMGNGADFLSWMRQAGLLTSDDIKAIRHSMSAQQLDTVVRDARALRDWFRGFVRQNMGRPLKRRTLDQLGPLNQLLGSDATFWQIEPSENFQNRDKNEQPSPAALRLRPRRHWRKPDSLLCLVAEEIAKFICTVDWRHVKACEGGSCTLLFLDQSHRHGRRWCVMAICGNRAKAAAFVARSKRVKKNAKF